MSLIQKKLSQHKNNFRGLTLRHHVIFWLIYFSLNFLRWGSYFDDYWYSLITNFIGFPIHITLCYLNIYVLMPKLLFKRKFLSFILSILTAVYLMVVLKFYLTYYLVSNDVWPEGPEIINAITLNYTVNMMIGEIYVIAFVTAIKITMDWIKEHRRLMDLEKVQLETELQFLRTQISPHFFFNTLNNIYSLTIEKSNKTPKIILKLSELMRYLLYDTKVKRQSLEKEIICIQNYLDLEKIRHKENLEINMEISGEIRDKNIAPILLLSFIENSFKHGVRKNIGKIRIDINFKIEKNFLYFSISNPIPTITNFDQKFDPKGGIGLKNVKKRLSLGYKPDEYELKINAGEKFFKVDLKIKV